MNREDLQDKIKEIITPVINAIGIELYDVEFKRMKGQGLVRVFIEKDGGVSLDDCERVSREIEAALDVEDPVPYAYVLEVSSPGLDRLIKNYKDFEKYSGRAVRIVTNEQVDKQTFFVGKIAEAGEDEVTLLLPKDKKVVIQHKNISKARLEVEV